MSLNSSLSTYLDLISWGKKEAVQVVCPNLQLLTPAAILIFIRESQISLGAVRKPKTRCSKSNNQSDFIFETVLILSTFSTCAHFCFVFQLLLFLNQMLSAHIRQTEGIFFSVFPLFSVFKEKEKNRWTNAEYVSLNHLHIDDWGFGGRN